MKKAAMPAPIKANMVTAAVAPGVESVFCCRRETLDGQDGEVVVDELELSSIATAKLGRSAIQMIPMAAEDDLRGSRGRRRWNRILP